MRVLVCPDKFAGTLSAVQAAQAIASGWLRSRPGDEIQVMPLSDGGPGFVEVLHANLGGELHSVTVENPLGRPVVAQWLEHDGVAYVEAAQANGLHLVPAEDRDVRSASTRGVGQLIADALPLPVVIGLGGSATNDGGRGAVEFLGDVPDLLIATDVDCPLLGPAGATYGFARQKGASEADLPGLEERMRVWAQQAPELAELPGAGAAGGLGFGLMLLGGQRVSGIQVVAQAIGLDQACAAADLVITGEGKVDWQSLHGKVLSGVLASSEDVLVLAGQIDVDDVRGFSLLDFDEDRAFKDPAGCLEDLAAKVASDLAA
jgi:glycerate 2-kinase